MNNNTPHTHPVHAEPSLRYAQPGDIMKDLARFGPAPNASREALVTIVALVLAGAILAIVNPAPVLTAIVAAAVVVYVAARWALGVRKWGQR